MKLTSRHLACYLPYGLTVKCADTGEIMHLSGLSVESTAECTTIINGEEFSRLMAIDKSEDSEEYIIPYLRSLSDLTKPINHNGETFIPIVVLAEISCGKIKGPYEVRHKDGAYGIKFIDSDEEEVVFSTCGRNFYLHTTHNKAFSQVYNQLELFQKLAEWHFDYHVPSLLESVLALPIE